MLFDHQGCLHYTQKWQLPLKLSRYTACIANLQAPLLPTHYSPPSSLRGGVYFKGPLLGGGGAATAIGRLMSLLISIGPPLTPALSWPSPPSIPTNPFPLLEFALAPILRSAISSCISSSSSSSTPKKSDSSGLPPKIGFIQLLSKCFHMLCMPPSDALGRLRAVRFRSRSLESTMSCHTHTHPTSRQPSHPTCNQPICELPCP